VSNPEDRNQSENVHIIMGFLRKKDNTPDTIPKCVRRILKDDLSLRILEAELKAMGGSWRIHITVNKRSTTKAKNELIKILLDHPEKAMYVDSAWKTVLLQPECRAENKFMLDVDSQDINDLRKVCEVIAESGGKILNNYDSPSGIHIITEPFDTRKVCELSYVTLLRDGYCFVKIVGKE